MVPSFFKKWTDRFRKPVAPEAGSSRADIRAWQAVLLQEQERLSRELTELLATYERSLNYFSVHVTEMDEATLRKECCSLESIRTVLHNAIRRLEVSTKDDQELQNEWQEWRAVRDTSAQALEVTQEQRIEMIRSELAVRGLGQTASEPKQFFVEAEYHPTQTAFDVVVADPLVFVQERLDNLDDWQEIQSRQLQAAHEHWSERLEEALARAEQDPHYTATVIARFRAVQGERKLLRRR